MDERRPPDGEAHIRSHGLSRAERTATAAINKEAELNGLPPLEHPAPPLERCLGPLLEELRTRSSDGMSDPRRKHRFTCAFHLSNAAVCLLYGSKGTLELNARHMWWLCCQHQLISIRTSRFQGQAVIQLERRVQDSKSVR